MMNEDNSNLGLKQDNLNISNNTESPSVPNQNYFQQSPIETPSQFTPVHPPITQDGGVKPPKNNKKNNLNYCNYQYCCDFAWSDWLFCNK